MNFTKTKLIALSTGAVLALFTSLFIVKRRSRANSRLQSQQNSISNTENLNSHHTEAEAIVNLLDQVSSKIQITFMPNSNILTSQTITQIFTESIDYVATKYIEITIQNRRERRSQKQHFENYIDLLLNYNEQVENLIEEGQGEILDKLNIKKEVFEESCLQLMETGFFQQFYLHQASLKQKMKTFIPAKKKINIKQLKEIIKYQVQILTKLPPAFTKMINKLQEDQEQQQMIPILLNGMLQDEVFEKFNVEEEECIITIKEQEMTMDPDLYSLLGMMESAMSQILGPLGLGEINQMPDGFDSII